MTLDKKVARKQEQDRRAGVREMIEDAQEDQEDEQDIERWENELIRHGGVRPQRREEKARDPYAPPADYRPAEGKILAHFFHFLRKRHLYIKMFLSIHD